MSTTLIQFARTGNPQHAAIPQWLRYELPERGTLIFDHTPRIKNDPRRRERELFATAPYLKPGT